MVDPDLKKILDKKARSMKERSDKVETTQPLNLTSDNFNGAMNSGKPVIVDFWAGWCSPCLYMAPVFEKLANKYGEKMVFGRLNVDDNRDVAARYQVFSIPTFMVFVDGKPSDTVVGAVGEKGLEKLIAKYVE
ncbi:MAG: thioredoxin [Candidatus Methylarchaceae archaeon HK01B]|nr:thioredoxin [Candidatus Methylarchaceae archaeon HK02M1]MCP8318857.1 thioredoxin [Candidatus Methylarchaceae archaeon HK01B]